MFLTKTQLRDAFEESKVVLALLVKETTSQNENLDVPVKLSEYSHRCWRSPASKKHIHSSLLNIIDSFPCLSLSTKALQKPFRTTPFRALSMLQDYLCLSLHWKDRALPWEMFLLPLIRYSSERLLSRKRFWHRDCLARLIPEQLLIWIWL